MERDDLVAGVDVGGTKTAVGTLLQRGLEAEQEALLMSAFEIFETPQDPSELIERIGRSLEDLLQDQRKTSLDLAGVGLAFPGDLDPDSGQVLTAPNIPAFVGLAPSVLMREELQRRFSRDLPVTTDNDTCAAVLAEARFGAGRGYQRLLYLTVSTGLGGARHDGNHPVNLEPGLKTFPDPQRPDLCLERLASGSALARRARHHLHETLARRESISEVTSVLTLEDLSGLPIESALDRLSARHLAEAAAQGDAFSASLLEDSARLTAASLRKLLFQGYGEEKVIVGGSIALKTKGYLDNLRASLAEALRDSGDRPPLDPMEDVVEAGLGDERGVVGAALLAETRR